MAKPVNQQFSEVFSESKTKLTGLINSLVRDSNETQDLLQDVYLELLENNEIDVAIESISAWLVTVAKNKVFDRFRKNKTRASYEQSAILMDSEAMLSQAPDPEAESSNSELRLRIREAVRHLPSDQQEVFIQHELEGKSFEEISKSTGIGINTLLSRKRYAMQFLREYLEEVHNEFK